MRGRKEGARERGKKGTGERERERGEGEGTGGGGREREGSGRVLFFTDASPAGWEQPRRVLPAAPSSKVASYNHFCQN